jgi:IS5 family transposase
MRNFVGIKLGLEPAPYQTSVCEFRHLLERPDLCQHIVAEGNGCLTQRELQTGTGTIVDATILQAPSSIKNKSGKRDAKMHPVKKSDQWYFGM